MTSFLHRHSISKRQRAKITDWIIEVLSIFKQSNETTFRALHLMDLYLKHEKQTQTLRDLHLTGVVCMFIASKLHAVIPIKLPQLVREIAKNKFTSDEIQRKEITVLRKIEFRTNMATVFCFSSCLFEISTIPKTFKTAIKKYAMLLQKMFVFSYDIVNAFSPDQLAVYAVIISLKLFEHSYGGFGGQKIIFHLIKLSCLPKGQILENLGFLRDFASNFKEKFPFNRLKNSKTLVTK